MPPVPCANLLRVEQRHGLFFPLDDRRRLDDVLAEDVALDEVGEPDVQFVADETLGRDGEDLCGRDG